MANNPICKMEVDEEITKYISKYKGKSISFVHLGVRKPLMKILINIYNINEIDVEI